MVLKINLNLNIDLNKTIPTLWRRTFSSKNSYRKLQNNLKQLESYRTDVLTKIESGKREHKVPLHAPVQWLSEVESIKIEFEKLVVPALQQPVDSVAVPALQQPVESVAVPANQWFFFNYIFGKNVDSVKKVVDSLLARGEKILKSEVTHPESIRSSAKIPVEPTIGMDSMLAEACSYMEEDGVGIIAVHGMGGVGKTKLMMDLHNKLYDHTPTRFDVIFWIVISKTPNLSNIQNYIGSILGFLSNEWKEKSQMDKARDICQILTPMKYALFLDDVWERLDLVTLGVPWPNLINKSKIVHTSQLKDVCDHMGADKSIEVASLKEEEAWILFKQNVGGKAINSDPAIQEIAKRVAKECGGLPLALKVIGQTMSKRTTRRPWNHAFEQLKKHPAEAEGMDLKVWSVLKLSYDDTLNVSTRSCFLYCSLYPENYLIHKDEIVDKWRCEGFLVNDESEKARNEGYDYIETLLNASLLLEESSSPDHIKMHGVIRRMAIWIGGGCVKINRKYVVRAGEGLTETPEVAEFEGSERMSLMVNQIPNLIGNPNCPNLLTLFLNSAQLNHIDNGFFQSMPNLRVLDLSDNDDLTEIPEEVYNLETLQYLNLFKTGISTRPNNLPNLINLKWLRFPEGL